MKTDQNQQELSFEQLMEFNNFSLDDTTKKEEIETNIVLDNSDDNDDNKKSEGDEDNDNPDDLELSKGKSKDEPKEPETKITLDNSDNTYLEIIKDKLESGEWDDVLVEDEEGNEVKLSELKDIDKDTFKTLEKEIKTQKEAEFKEKYVSVEDLDEVKKRLINIVKEGDLELAKALFQNPAALQEPFKGFDNDNDDHNEDVLFWYYEKGLGHSQKEAAALVKASKEDLTLDVKAQKIVEYQRNQFYENLKNREKEILEEKAKEQENLKTYRKNLISELKQEGLSETLTKKFVDVATKTDKTGNYEIDTIYDEWMSDPKKAKELIYFMLDKDNYIKKVTAAVKKDVQLDNLKRIKLVQDSSKVEKQKKEESAPITPFETLNFE
jgi:hypothetical protein